MIDKSYTYAVVGASHDSEKYGHKVFKDLLGAGFKVYPVNPKGGELLGQHVFKGVGDITEVIDVAIMVVPPNVSLKVLEDLADKGIEKVWFQPGSENEEVLEKAGKLELEQVNGSCIMVERRKS
jgi:hypothetical protein